jgi:hypothetical protein
VVQSGWKKAEKASASQECDTDNFQKLLEDLGEELPQWCVEGLGGKHELEDAASGSAKKALASETDRG